MEYGNEIDSIIKIRNDFENLKNKHQDDNLFCESVSDAMNNDTNNFPSAEDIKKEFEVIHDTDRLLRIGIVGAVKAGKSSLLNALFFDGKDILPKAATPMTAALTQLEYGEKCELSIDFFTDSDVITLENKAKEYETRLQDETQRELEELEKNWKEREQRKNPTASPVPSSVQKKEWQEKAKKNAKNTLNENISLGGAKEQFDLIKKANRKTGSETIPVNSVDDIASKLKDYVGADGKYMPFTSRVTLRLPFETLKDVCVIDTPGFNDPVPSRDAKAKKALSECDVVLILSPSRQFLSRNDLDVIQKITGKDGIRELFIIPSQIDNQLHGPDISDEADGDIEKAMNAVLSSIIPMVEKNLSRFDALQQLCDESKNRTLPTSGMCQSMLATWNNRKSWDEGRKKSWENLSKHYPDYFSEQDENTTKLWLKKLGNIEKIDACINSVKTKKDEIFADKIKNFSSKYKAAAQDAKNRIIEDIEARQRELSSKDITSIEKELRNAENIVVNYAGDFNDLLEEELIEWQNETSSDYASFLDKIKDEVFGNISSAKDTKTRTYTTGHLWWKKTHTEEYDVVNSTEIEIGIDNFVSAFYRKMPSYIEGRKFTLRKKIQGVMLNTLAGKIEDLDTDEISRKTRVILSDILNSSEKLDKNYASTYSYSVDENNSEATKVSNARKEVNKLTNNFYAQLDDIVESIVEKCKRVNLGEKVLSGYVANLESKKKEFENKKLSAEKLSRIKTEVESLNCDF